MVGLGAPIVPGGAVTIGQLDGQATAHQGLEALVDGGKGNTRDLVPNRQEHLICVGVGLGVAQVPVNGGTLIGEALPARLEGPPEA